MNYKTLKSNEQRLLYEPCHIWHPKPYLKVANCSCKELHVVCSRVPKSVSDRGLNQQAKAFLKELLYLRFSKSFKELLESTKYLIYNRCLCEFTRNLTQSLWTGTNLGKCEQGRFNSEKYSELCWTSKTQCFAILDNGLLAVNYFPKTFHLTCSIGFWIRLCNCNFTSY